MRNTTVYYNKPKTFRRSSGKLMRKYGSNLQNVEKSMRQMYIPDGFQLHNIPLQNKCKYWLESGDDSIFTEEELQTANCLIQCDQSGAEALIVAYDSQAGDYRELFKNNVKVHVYVAMKLFKDIWQKKMKEKGGVDFDIEVLDKTPIASLKLNPNWKELDALIKDSDNWNLSERYYYLAKQTVHSANYDIQWANFILNILDKSGGKINVKREQGEYFLKTYRALFPEIPESNRRIREQVDKYKMLYNLFGFPYIITNENITESTYKEYYAWPRQSTVGEITRIAFTNLYYYIMEEKKKWDVLQDNHDSYLVQCSLREVKECGDKMKEFMNIEMTSPVDGVKFSMKSEMQVGFNWGIYDKNNPDKNPLGLRELSWI